MSGTAYDEADFQPSPETASRLDSTPSTRNYEDNLPVDTKKKVDRAPGNITQRRCLIDNIWNLHVVDYAHVLSRADGKKDGLVSSLIGLVQWKHLTTSKISKLERSWNVKSGTLNSNTHRNIFRRAFLTYFSSYN